MAGRFFLMPHSLATWAESSILKIPLDKRTQKCDQINSIYSTTSFLQSECLHPSRNETPSGHFLKVLACDGCRMRCFPQSVMWPCGLTFLFVKPADAAAVVVWLQQQLSEELPQMDGLAGVAAHHVWPGIVVSFCEGFSESVTTAI